jgi:hypothetical protein
MRTVYQSSISIRNVLTFWVGDQRRHHLQVLVVQQFTNVFVHVLQLQHRVHWAGPQTGAGGAGAGAGGAATGQPNHFTTVQEQCWWGQWGEKAKEQTQKKGQHLFFPPHLFPGHVSRPPLFPGHTCFPPHLFPATLVSRHPFSPDFPFHPQLTFGARQQRFVTRRRGRLVGNDGGFSQPVHHVIGVQVKHGSVFPTQHAPQHTRGMDRAFFLSWARKKRVNTQCAKTQK